MSVDLRAEAGKIIAQLRRIPRAVALPIELEMNLRPRPEVTQQIFEEKLPFRRAPEVIGLMIVEADHVSRHHIELRAKRGQWDVAFDPPYHARHAKEICDFGEHRGFADVETEDVVAKPLADVKKVTGAAADIENALAEAEVEFEVAHAPDVRFHPTSQLQVFLWRITWFRDGMPLVNRAEFLFVDAGDDPLRIDTEHKPPREEKSAGMAPHAGEQARVGKLLDLLSETHGGSDP